MEFIREIKKAKWNLSVDNTTDDTEILNLMPDPVCNINTSEMKISVWDIGTNRERFGNIVKALTKGRKLKNFDFAIFSSDLLDDLGVEFNKSGSPLNEIIGDHHYDIEIPTSKNLLELTKSLILNADLNRMYAKQIENLP